MAKVPGDGQCWGHYIKSLFSLAAGKKNGCSLLWPLLKIPLIEKRNIKNLMIRHLTSAWCPYSNKIPFNMIFFIFTCFSNMNTGGQTSPTASSRLVRTALWWFGMRMASGMMSRVTITSLSAARRAQVIIPLANVISEALLPFKSLH